ncbi:NAD-dependent succinate-semialdehyde dehydrogenase [Gallaecimonas sp. GXIMD4217]|uniref:NAD-dependent succinate-semialdehyde dehydrogenase n=1 Tax=Gallaecimonas sp. GXIMD4217 TaxID=3131927 RepID=UPI00311B306D
MHLEDSELLRSKAYVNGRWLDADTRASVMDPATGQELAQVPMLGEEAVQQAIDAAELAFHGWRTLSGHERARRLYRWYELMHEHLGDLAQIMTAEQGKPLAEAKGEIRYAASFVQWFAEEAKRSYGDIIPSPRPGQKLLVSREPVGVVAAITPWNFPAAMITRKVAPALAAGCTAVVKPALETPLSALALAELAERAGIPAGVFNVVTGDAEVIGKVLTSSAKVRKLSFTGSTRIGSLLMAACAPDIKKLSLELGGNAPFIVFDDADLDAAIEGVMAAKFRNAGQTCVCANRIYVQDRIYDDFAERLAIAMNTLTLGKGTEPGVTTGPLINQAAVDKVRAHIADATSKGANIRLGGQAHEKGPLFFQPTLLTDMNKEMRIAAEETFGPVAPLFRFIDEADAIAAANDSPFGLAAYFYTTDLARAFRVADALESGMVGVNTGLVSNEVAPFGGVKASGLGREGSKYGMEEYQELKYICLDGLG